MSSLRLLPLAPAFAALALHAQPSPTPPAEEPPVTLREFVVSADGAVGYRSLDSISGSNTRIAIRELPLSVSVFTEEFLRDVGANSLMESVAYSSSASVNSTNQFNRVTFSIRGYESVNLRDGFRWELGNDSYNIERVEVVKGPAAVLYGSSQAGGFVNVLSRRPQNRFLGSARVTLGDFDKRRAELDVNQPLVPGKVLFRFMAAYDDFDSHRAFESTENTLLNPVLTWKPLERASWTVGFERSLHRHTPVNGLPISQDERRWIEVPIDWNNAGPYVFEDIDTDVWNSDLQLEVNDHVSVRNQTTYFTVDRTELRRAVNRLGVSGAPNDGRSLAGAINYGTDERETFNNKVEAVIKFGSESTWQNKTLVGWQYTDFFVRQVGPLRIPGFTPSVIDIFRQNLPFDQYYAIAPGPNWSVFDASRYTQRLGGTLSEGSDDGYYIVNHLWMRNRLVHLQSGVRFAEPFDFGDAATVPQLGLVLQPTREVSIYALYNESYLPQTGVNQQTGQPHPPQTGKSREVGVKAEFLGGRLGANLALFDIDREGIVRRNTSIPGLPFDEASGLENSRGVELEAYYSPNRNYNVVVGYTYLDTEVRSNVAEPILVGTRTQSAPRHKASLWHKYTWTAGRLNGWSIGAGLIASSDSQAFNFASRLQMLNEAYTRLDAMVSYRTKVGRFPVAAQVNVRNLLDEKYREIQARFAPPLNLTGSVTVRF